MIERPQMPKEPLASYEHGSEDGVSIMDGGEVPWGDYGAILAHGMSCHLGRLGGEDGPIQLERTGPFVPPITFPGPGDIVVTTEMKETMQDAGFRGILFRPVIKAHIVEVPWHTWDLEAEEPPYWAEEGEPEGLILDQEHSPSMAHQLGDLWEIVRQDGAKVERVQMGSKAWEVRFHYVPGTWNGNDLFSVKTNRYRYVSPRAKRWFERHFSRWTSFRDGTDHCFALRSRT